MKHVVTTDWHTATGDCLDRFTALGNLILEEAPDEVLCLGDLGTLDACSYFMDEGERPDIYEDRDAMLAACKEVFAPMQRWNRKQARKKKAQYKPNTRWLLGNHEYRLERQCKDNELVRQLIGNPIKWFGLDQYWSHVYPYKEYVVVDNVQYVHNATAATGRPISGVNRGRRIALESAYSTVYGHHHTLDLRSVPLLGNANGSRIALNAPAFMDQENVEEWAKENQTGWHYGLLIIDTNDSPDAPFSFKWMRTSELLRDYL